MARPIALLPACTARVSAVMAKLGARSPQTRYLGRSLTAAAGEGSESGTVRTLCSFLTESGLERELEIPVVVNEGEIVDPAVAMVGGNPVLLSASLIENISKSGSVYERPAIGGMYSTSYTDPNLYRELRESQTPVPRVYRPLF